MNYWYNVVLNLSHKVTYISNYDQKQLRPARMLNFRPRTQIHSILEQACRTCGPRAACGPLQAHLRPAQRIL